MLTTRDCTQKHLRWSNLRSKTLKCRSIFTQMHDLSSRHFHFLNNFSALKCSVNERNNFDTHNVFETVFTCTYRNPGNCIFQNGAAILISYTKMSVCKHCVCPSKNLPGDSNLIFFNCSLKSRWTLFDLRQIIWAKFVFHFGVKIK